MVITCLNISGMELSLPLQMKLKEGYTEKIDSLLSAHRQDLISAQRKGSITGRILQPNNMPIPFAEISSVSKKYFTKSNIEGDFIIRDIEFPATIRISKIGYKDILMSVNKSDSIKVILIPFEYHNGCSGLKKQFEFDVILKYAVNKLVPEYSESFDQFNRRIVYFKSCSTVDGKIGSLFESFGQIKTGMRGLDDYQPYISRYAHGNQSIPEMYETKFIYRIDAFFSLPLNAGNYILRKGYFMQDSDIIAIVSVKLNKSLNTYYISMSDTSLVYITSLSKSEKSDIVLEGQLLKRQKITNSIEVSFSTAQWAARAKYIDNLFSSETYIFTKKDEDDITVSKNLIFQVVPGPSTLYSNIKEEVANTELTEINRQINFRGKLASTPNKSDFNTETERLLTKRYNKEFWLKNICIKHNSNELSQIETWEKDKTFYSQEHNTYVNESVRLDTLVNLLNKNIIPVENVYLMTDRNSYLAGDTIWFSAFVVDNLSLDSISQSRILHVDLINPQNAVEKHLKLNIVNGRTHGDFLIKKETKNGVYRLRAYTQYMMNFQSDYLFEREIPVHEFDFTKMIILNPLVKGSLSGNLVEIAIKSVLPDEYNSQIKTLDFVINLTDTLCIRKTITFKDKITESIHFFVPDSISCRRINIEFILSGDKLITKGRETIPLKSGINLQFFPESGKMVDGIQSVIACKATDERGFPTRFKASVVDENDTKILDITGNDSGVGCFNFTPDRRHSYRAVVTLGPSQYYSNLPVVEPSGYILNYKADSCDLVIKNSREHFKEKCYLLFANKGIVFKAFETKLGNKSLKVHLPLKSYPKGIIQITLYDSLFRPLAERLIFNNKADQKMIIHITPDRKTYKQNETVTLTINTTDISGRPVPSTFSLAVVDAAKSDTINKYCDIESYLYLSSELKGTINCNLLNLSDTTGSGAILRDLVMITQGWRNYLWNSIRYKYSNDCFYPPEKGFSISGIVYSQGNRESTSEEKLDYIDFKSKLNDKVKIDKNNRFKIYIPFFYDTHVFFIQSKDKNDKLGKLGITVDSIPYPSVIFRNNELPYAEYKSSYLREINDRFTEAYLPENINRKYIKLGEVKITARSDKTGFSTPDKSVNLEKEDQTGEKYANLFQMINAEFGEKAFTSTGYGTHSTVRYPILVVNGTPLTADLCPPCYDYAAYDWALSIPVREISEVRFYDAESQYSKWLSPPPPGATPKYDVTHQFELYSITHPKIYLPVVSFKTSNSYRGNPRGSLIIPLQGIYKAREFYQPVIDNRSNEFFKNVTTIYWNPEVETDSSGKTEVTFRNSDAKGKAYIKISGISFLLNDASSTSGSYLSY